MVLGPYFLPTLPKGNGYATGYPYCLRSRDILLPPVALGADRAKDKPKPSAPAKKAAEKPAVKTEKSAAKVEKPAVKTEKPVAKAEKPAAKTTKKPVVVLFTLQGAYPEGNANSSLFGELRPSLASIVQRMDAAADDKDVSAVWLKIEDLAIGRGKIYELRGAIARLRAAKKPVYAELTTAEGGQYLLAGACEKIVMPPSGMLIVPGVRAEITFFKGLLDKLGLQFDALQMGKYKGAAEPLTRNAMSQPLRESLDALVDDTYENLVATIAADRRLKDYQVKTLVDQGLFTAAAAKKAGMIDDVLYADQLQDAIKKALQAGDVEIVRNYKKQHIDTDFSGMSGMMKLFDLFRGAKSTAASGKRPKIAVVYAVGPITEGKSGSDFFGNTAMGASTIVGRLAQGRRGPQSFGRRAADR